MRAENRQLLQRRLRSPRAAAVAGILFAFLQTSSMVLISFVEAPDELSREWLQTWSDTIHLVLTLVPFSGIAFLWFTGVIRDQIGAREDRFFETIFLGSGILYVGLLFVWAASFGAIFRSYSLAESRPFVDHDIYIFGFALMKEILGNYALRMQGVYMLSIGSLWTRTDVAPRWLVILTYVVALGFLFFAGRFRLARYVFPGWMFLASVYILVVNYRRGQGQEGEEEKGGENKE